MWKHKRSWVTEDRERMKGERAASVEVLCCSSTTLKWRGHVGRWNVCGLKQCVRGVSPVCEWDTAEPWGRNWSTEKMISLYNAIALALKFLPSKRKEFHNLRVTRIYRSLDKIHCSQFHGGTTWIKAKLCSYECSYPRVGEEVIVSPLALHNPRCSFPH